MKLIVLIVMNYADKSRPARGAWIETMKGSATSLHQSSRPARGAWIETRRCLLLHVKGFVAPRTGRVD